MTRTKTQIVVVSTLGALLLLDEAACEPLSPTE